MDGNDELARELGTLLVNQGEMLSAAESLTGGSIGSTITSVPGAGEWFAASIVVYDLLQKEKLLGVSREVLNTHGAVSKECVEAMVRGVLEKTGSKYGVAVSGEAGPNAKNAPIGTVWFAWAKGESVWSSKHMFSGERDEIRRRTVEEALRGLLNVAAGLRPDFN